MPQKHMLAAFNLMLLLFFSVSAKATNFSYSGDFNKSDNVHFFYSPFAVTSTNLKIQNLLINTDTNINTLGGTEAILLNADFFGSLIAENYILMLEQFDETTIADNLSDKFTHKINMKSAPFETLRAVNSSNWPVDASVVDTTKTSNTPTSVALTLLVVSLIGLCITTQRKIRSAIASIFNRL